MNTQRLLDLIKANEESEGFDMEYWLSPCRTYGCLVGNYVLSKYLQQKGYNPKEKEYVLNNFIIPNQISHNWIMQHFEISERYVEFLFSPNDRHEYKDKEGAINRVRKFVYYFLRKKEMQIIHTQRDSCIFDFNYILKMNNK